MTVHYYLVSKRMMEATHYRDSTGAPLRVGDVVRILGTPDLHGMAEPYRSESEAVFRHLIGKYKRVSEFDAQGLAWLRFTIRNGPHAGMHAVGIEPSLLRIAGQRRARGQRLAQADRRTVGADQPIAVDQRPLDPMSGHGHLHAIRFRNPKLQSQLVAGLEQTGLGHLMMADGFVECGNALWIEVNSIAHRIRDSCFKWYFSWCDTPQQEQELMEHLRRSGLRHEIEERRDRLVFLLPKEDEAKHSFGDECIERLHRDTDDGTEDPT